MEDRLTTAFSELWQEILADPEVDLPDAVAGKLKSLAGHLDCTFSARI